MGGVWEGNICGISTPCEGSTSFSFSPPFLSFGPGMFARTVFVLRSEYREKDCRGRENDDVLSSAPRVRGGVLL